MCIQLTFGQDLFSFHLVNPLRINKSDAKIRPDRRLAFSHLLKFQKSGPFFQKNFYKALIVIDRPVWCSETVSIKYNLFNSTHIIYFINWFN